MSCGFARKTFSTAVKPYRAGSGRRRRVHVRLVLARGPVRRDEAIPFTLGHALYAMESDPRRQGEERSRHRRRQNSGSVAWRHVPDGIRLPACQTQGRRDLLLHAAAASSISGRQLYFAASSTPTASTTITPAHRATGFYRASQRRFRRPLRRSRDAIEHPRPDLKLIDNFDDADRRRHRTHRPQDGQDRRPGHARFPAHDPRHRQYLEPGDASTKSTTPGQAFPRSRQLPVVLSRLVRCQHESAGKRKAPGGKKIGNAPPEVGFRRSRLLDAACHARRQEMARSPGAQAWQEKSPIGVGGEDWSHGVSPHAQTAGVRPEAILRLMTYTSRPRSTGAERKNK